MNWKWGFWFQNGTLRSYWNFLVNIVPDNQICKIIQHIDSVEKVLLKYKILNNKQIRKISAKLSNVSHKWSMNCMWNYSNSIFTRQDILISYLYTILWQKSLLHVIIKFGLGIVPQASDETKYRIKISHQLCSVVNPPNMLPLFFEDIENGHHSLHICGIYNT